MRGFDDTSPLRAPYGSVMPMSPYLAGIRERIGSRLLVVPTVAVLPRDDDGRILLVRVTDTDRWATIGGAIEPDESPEDAAVREAAEEAGVVVQLRSLVTVLGGPEYRMTYPNGDLAAFVPVVFDAVVVSGEPRPDLEETSEVGWFAPAELAELELNDVNWHLLHATIPRLEPRP